MTSLHARSSEALTAFDYVKQGWTLSAAVFKAMPRIGGPPTSQVADDVMRLAREHRVKIKKHDPLEKWIVNDHGVAIDVVRARSLAGAHRATRRMNRATRRTRMFGSSVNRASDSSSPPKRFKSAGGRTFSIGPKEGDDENERYGIRHKGTLVGYLFKNLNYGRDKPRWQGSLSALRWSKFGGGVPNVLGFDVGPFDTAREVIAAWSNKADEVFDYQDGKRVRSIYSKTGYLQKGSTTDIPAPFWR